MSNGVVIIFRLIDRCGGVLLYGGGGSLSVSHMASNIFTFVWGLLGFFFTFY